MDSCFHDLEYTRMTDLFGVGELEGQVYSSGLLANLTKNFGRRTEDPATGAMGHIQVHFVC